MASIPSRREPRVTSGARTDPLGVPVPKPRVYGASEVGQASWVPALWFGVGCCRAILAENLWITLVVRLSLMLSCHLFVSKTRLPKFRRPGRAPTAAILTVLRNLLADEAGNACRVVFGCENAPFEVQSVWKKSLRVGTREATPRPSK